MTDKKPLRNANSYPVCDYAQSKNMFNYLLEKAILLLTPEMLHGPVSYAHTHEDIKNLVSAVERYVKTIS